MREMKRKIFLICSVIFILTGCIDRDLGDKNEDKANTNQNYLNYKQNIYCEWGKESAYYEGRIYYFQNEGEPGIYSMDTRGKDKQLEVSVSNIRKLQVRDDGIYFAAPIEDTYPRRYIIYHKKWDSKQPQEYLITNPYLEYGENNVWDFYINKNDTMIVVAVYARIPRMNLSFDIFAVNDQKEMVSLPYYKKYLENYNLDEEEYFNLFQCDNLFIMSRSGLESRERLCEGDLLKEYEINLDEANTTIYCQGQDETVFFRTYAIYNERDMDSVLQTIDEDLFVVSNGNYLLWVPQSGQEIARKLELPEITDIRFSVRDGDDLIVIGDQDKKMEYIYRVSLETAEIKESYPIEKGEKVLAVTDKMLYTVSEKALYVYSHGEKGYEQEACMKWEKKLKTTSKLEMCGNMAFVYDVGEKDAEFVLQEYHVLEEGLAK